MGSPLEARIATRRRQARRTKNAFVGLAVVCTTTVCADAIAQTKDEALATELFQQGRELVKQQRSAEACVKFEESQRLDARVGTLLNLADCEESAGRLASARAHWQQAVALAQARGDERLALARERFASLDKRVPRIVIKLPQGTPTGIVVERDQVPLGRGSFEIPIPVDPGRHTLSASAPGFEAWRASVEVRPEETREVTVVLERARQTTAPDAREPLGLGGLRVAALVSGGVGLLALGGAGYFALRASKKRDDSNVHGCDPSNACDEPGLTERSEARTLGDVATALLVVGSVALAAGATMWLVAPSSKSAQTTGATAGLRVTPGGGVLVGTW
jgi:hypothetical protein